MEVDEHLAVALSGMVADARTLVDYGRVAAQVNHDEFSLLFLNLGC